ncbi:low temperature requirement protein A [Paracoccus sp. (in: a-proteobacteria)]|uniref:low temperature requirement protein A n=1 Tax=Paracoccus sp. TaxID=267 RepID=UPI00321FB490
MPTAADFRFAARDPHEGHRGASPLELIFDLATVIAIAAAAHGLAGAVESGRILPGVIGFLCSFFMIWWAWMNYSWFASAYDDSSSGFRMMTMVVMFGALMLAAGIGAVFAGERIWLALLGFVIMRAGMVAFWLGAARGDPGRRATAHAYAAGIGAMQIWWIAVVVLVAPQSPAYLPLFLLGVAGELAVPVRAERRGATPWHRQHMIERYGGLNVIVLAEVFLAISAMIRLPAGAALPDAGLIWLALLSAVIAFALWGIYFAEGAHLTGEGLHHALLWGYGHLALFAAGAATGAGLTVMRAVASHAAHVPARSGIVAVTLPVAVYLAVLWLIRDRLCLAGAARWLLPAAAALVLVIGRAAPVPAALPASALLLAGAALLRRSLAQATAG